MTLEQVQHEVVTFTDDERLRLAAFLKHLSRVNSEENKAELSRLNRTIDAGEGVTLEQWREMHTALEAEGK